MEKFSRFEKILVIHSEKTSEKHISIVKRIANELKELDLNIAKCGDLSKNLFEGIDLAVTIGGDGVFIKSADFIRNELPILGINSEPENSEGALTSIKDDEIKKFKEILNGNYKIEKMERIEARINGILADHYAVNEVYFGTETQFHASRYLIKFKDNEENQRSSGVLIATSKGSNAWFKSAGGVPFLSKEEIAFLIREPYIGSRLHNPKLINGRIKKNDSLLLVQKRHDGGILAFDSNFLHKLNQGDRVEIKLSDKYLRVIRSI